MNCRTSPAFAAALAAGLWSGQLRAEPPARPQYFQVTRTLAQTLVDELPKRYPDVQCGLIHAVLFDGRNHAVIASYKPSQVGEADEDEDNIVTDDQCVILNPRIGDKISRINLRLPVKDASGKIIRASWSIYFHSKPGDDPPRLLARAIAVRDDLARDIPSLEALFGPPPQPAAVQATWGKASENRIYAQQLVNAIVARNPDLLVLALHAVAPGAGDEAIIASNLDRIGKKDDDDDVSVAVEHRIILAPNPTDPQKFEVLVPLQDSGGRMIGAIGNVFKIHPGADGIALLNKALAIRAELSTQIPSADVLYGKTE